MANRDAFWRTRISDVRPNEVRIRGYDLMELIGSRSFGDVVFLLLSGDLPKGDEGRMMEALLVSCAEHSVMALSVDAARFEASAGVPLQAAVASGMIALGDRHGGAVEEGADLLLEAEALGFLGRYCQLALAFEDAVAAVFGRPLRMNIDGAMAALLLELGLEPGLGKALYVIGRAPGLVAHVHEEQTRERPYRDVGWRNVRYDGPDPRPVP